jgi:hypothetical protein
MEYFNFDKKIQGKFNKGDIVEVVATGEKATVSELQIITNLSTDEEYTEGNYTVCINSEHAQSRTRFQEVHEDDLKLIERVPKPDQPFTLNGM